MTKREQLARAADNAWMTALEEREKAGKPSPYPRDVLRTHVLPAIIAELREPDERMLVAARDWSYKKYGKPVGNDGATGCLQAMIDAIE